MSQRMVVEQAREDQARTPGPCVVRHLRNGVSCRTVRPCAEISHESGRDLARSRRTAFVGVRGTSKI